MISWPSLMMASVTPSRSFFFSRSLQEMSPARQTQAGFPERRRCEISTRETLRWIISRTFMHIDEHQTTRYLSSRAGNAPQTFRVNGIAMNAFIREPLECEGPVAANEKMIEASLASMRGDLGEVKTELRELRADNRAIREKIDAVQTILRDKVDEGSAASNSKIEAVNTSLTTKIEAVNTSLMAKMDQGFAACNSKIDGVNASLTTKIEAVNASLTAKIETVNTSLTTKMDQGFAACNSKADGFNTSLTAKIEALGQSISDMRGMQKAMFWVFGVVGSLVAIAGTLLTIGKTLHWF